MKKNLTLLFVTVVMVCSLNAQPGYHLTKTFRIGSPGGWDYPASDPGSNRLYVSHGQQVNILDKTTGDSVGVIAGTTGVHGIAFANSFGKGYTSNGRQNNVTVFDLTSGKALSQVAVGTNPDWIMYDAYSKRVITINHTGGDLTIINPQTDQVEGTIKVGGVLETAVSNNAGKLYVNVEDKNEIVVVDLAKKEATHRWALAPGEGPTGLAVDLATKRLFATCEKLLVIMDADNGAIVSKIPIGNGCDGAAFDPETRLIFTSNGEGTVSIIKEINANEFKLIETVPTKRGARTITLDEKTHKLYLPTADFEPLPAGAAPNMRAKMIPGTFQILVLEKK